MKVELISYAIRKNAQESYSLKAPIEQNNYALYLGEDNEHVWIHPFYVGTFKGDNVPQVIMGSVSRLMIRDIIIHDDERLLQYITNIPFGDMKHKGLTTFEDNE